MPQEELNRPRILLVVGELIPTPMPELMRVHGESQLRALPCLGHHLAHAGIGQRSFALGEKDIRGLACQALKFPQGANLCAGQRVRAGDPVLDASHVQEALIEIELIPAQVDEFGHAQAVPVGEENHRVIAVPMASEAASRFAQLLDLGWREMLTGPDVTMFMAFGKG
jgi:hypothetical protein